MCIHRCVVCFVVVIITKAALSWRVSGEKAFSQKKAGYEQLLYLLSSLLNNERHKIYAFLLRELFQFFFESFNTVLSQYHSYFIFGRRDRRGRFSAGRMVRTTVVLMVSAVFTISTGME